MKKCRRVRQTKTAGVTDVGFTLIELLIVMVVLGVLAAIVVFALTGVTTKTKAAACQSDAKTVGVGVGALRTENSKLTTLTSGTLSGGTWTSGSWEVDMLSTGSIPGLVGNPFVQSWPSSTSYTVQVADGGLVATMFDITGSGTAASITANATEHPSYGDVLVSGTGTGKASANHTYDATLHPVEACNFATLGQG